MRNDFRMWNKTAKKKPNENNLEVNEICRLSTLDYNVHATERKE